MIWLIRVVFGSFWNHKEFYVKMRVGSLLVVGGVVVEVVVSSEKGK